MGTLEGEAWWLVSFPPYSNDPERGLSAMCHDRRYGCKACSRAARWGGGAEIFLDQQEGGGGARRVSVEAENGGAAGVRGGHGGGGTVGTIEGEVVVSFLLGGVSVKGPGQSTHGSSEFLRR